MVPSSLGSKARWLLSRCASPERSRRSVSQSWVFAVRLLHVGQSGVSHGAWLGFSTSEKEIDVLYVDGLFGLKCLFGYFNIFLLNFLDFFFSCN